MQQQPKLKTGNRRNGEYLISSAQSGSPHLIQGRRVCRVPVTVKDAINAVKFRFPPISFNCKIYNAERIGPPAANFDVGVAQAEGLFQFVKIDGFGLFSLADDPYYVIWRLQRTPTAQRLSLTLFSLVKQVVGAH
jgi:hypothetical protein